MVCVLPTPFLTPAAPELYEAPSHAASWPREHMDRDDPTMSQMTGCHSDQATMASLALPSGAASALGEATGEAGSGTTRETTNDDEHNNAGNNSDGNALKR